MSSGMGTVLRHYLFTPVYFVWQIANELPAEPVGLIYFYCGFIGSSQPYLSSVSPVNRPKNAC
ncbi:hypothetical protein NJ56_05455 [Yersinia ruckeri]|nr:hypothetical protein NJ56_05455 [Yersinia ruckeri]